MSGERLTIRCIKVKQPIGEFYIGAIKAKELCEITKYDFRQLEKEAEGFATYLGIQRKVSPSRVKEIAKYVGTTDACFPTAIILAIPGVCADYNENKSTISLFPYADDEDPALSISYDQIAVVLDGQHRIAGFKEGSYDKDFEVNVSIFIDIDIADQAYIFSTVNLAQTKVNKSLVYDLFDLAKKRSPQKTCHNIAVALDKSEGSPFYQKIKRLGVATEGRFNETITQATFVRSLLAYISPDPVGDRDLYLRGKKPQPADQSTLERFIFRNMFIAEKDLDITDIIWNYFEAVQKRWPAAWKSTGTGIMLNKTNGFKALMRFLRPAYRNITAPGGVPSTKDFFKIFNKITLTDDDFQIENFRPGTSGESKLYGTLVEKASLL